MSPTTFITAAAAAGSVELISVAPEACGAVEVGDGRVRGGRKCTASEGSAPEVLDEAGDHQPGTDSNASQGQGVVADETGGRRRAPVLDDDEQVHDGDAQQDDAGDQEPDRCGPLADPGAGRRGWLVRVAGHYFLLSRSAALGGAG